MMATRGRPVGTRKREHAEAAARAILNGDFADIRDAAKHFCPRHIGSKYGFRDFVGYVEEAYIEIIRSEPGPLRRYRALTQRSRNRGPQPMRRADNDALKRHLNDVLGWALEVRDPNQFPPVGAFRPSHIRSSQQRR